MRRRLALLLVLASACTESTTPAEDAGVDSGLADSGTDAGPVDTGADAGPVDTGPGPGDSGQPPDDAGMAPPLEGTVSAEIHVDHLGWRPADRKVAVLVGHAAEAVEVRRIRDGAAVGAYTASASAVDEDSGDAAATVDLSALTEPGDYYLFLPTSGLRSYPFEVAETVYDIAGLAAAKSYYFQRCNHDRALPYAGDALDGHPGLGGRWVDAACHLMDGAVGPGPGSPDHGALDLQGGWHDAGDYQKTLWGRGVPELLFAYELNPGAWRDGQLGIPEGGNGVPDLLDEVAWELDFYVRMQRPDGHFMSSLKGHAATVLSPPSASDEARVYFDTTSPSGGEWSGGGVTLTEATGNAVLSLAHAAVVYAAHDAARAATYRAAALSGWGWLSAANPANANERRLRASAAAAVLRADPTEPSALAAVRAFSWQTWDGGRGSSATPSDTVVAAGAWHCLLGGGCGADTEAAIRDAAAQVIVAGAFSQSGVYGGMYGGPGNGWEWSWGSNRAQSMYGANLMIAARFGILGGHGVSEVVERAQRHLHFMLGLNPLAMVYLTNMAAYGAEHSSFQIYHAWFSYTGNDGDNGNASYNGRPAAVEEPLYPYYPDDAQTSMYGPAPGLVPGGPNFYYSAGYTIPMRERPAYAYRDFSVGCEWTGSACNASSWEITEPALGYQGPFVLLASFFMSR